MACSHQRLPDLGVRAGLPRPLDVGGVAPKTPTAPPNMPAPPATLARAAPASGARARTWGCPRAPRRSIPVPHMPHSAAGPLRARPSHVRIGVDACDAERMNMHIPGCAVGRGRYAAAAVAAVICTMTLTGPVFVPAGGPTPSGPAPRLRPAAARSHLPTGHTAVRCRQATRRHGHRRRRTGRRRPAGVPARPVLRARRAWCSDARWEGRSSGEAGLLPPYRQKGAARPRTAAAVDGHRPAQSGTGASQPDSAGMMCDPAVGQPPNVPVVSAFQAPPVTL